MSRDISLMRAAYRRISVSGGGGALRLAFGGGDVAGFHEALEAAEVFADLGGGVAAEQRGDPLADPAAGRDVVDHHFHFGAAPRSAWDEAHRAGVVDVGVGEGSPSDQGVGLVVDDFGVPLDRRAR